MLRFLSTAFALALLAACDETTAPILASNVYGVVTVDNKALPTDVPIQRRAGCDVGVLQRSEFAFGADAMFEQRFWFTSDPSEPPAVFRTSFVQHGSQVLLADGAGSGTIRGDILRLEMPPTQICASMTWEAVLK